MPQVNSIRGLSGIKAISKYEVDLTRGFQATAFTSNILHIGYIFNLETAVAAILIFVECPKSIASKVLSKCEVNPTSVFQATAFTDNILHIGYIFNLQTAVAAILIFVECPKPIASEVLVVLRSYQYEVNQISGFQDITITSNYGWTDLRTDRQTDRAIQ